MGKTLYLECYSGISGDMTVGALLDLGAREEALREALEALPLKGYEITIGRTKKCGIDACDFDVILEEEGHEHCHGEETHHEHTHDEESHEHHEHSHVEEYHEHKHGTEHCHDEEHHVHEHSHGEDHVHDHGAPCEHIHEDSIEHCHSAEGGHSHDHEHSHGAPDHSHEHTHSEHAHTHAPEPHDHSHEDGAHTHSPEAHDHHHSHVHRHYADIMHMLDEAPLKSEVRTLAKKIFHIVGEAESRVHACPLEEVHFHETGAVDSIVDIVGAAACAVDLGITETYVSTIYEGQGHVWCQHGRIPVPAPAVAGIAAAEELDLAITNVSGEMVTPTGAAIAAALRTKKGLPKAFVIRKIGMGAGKKDFPHANLLRAMIIEPAMNAQPAGNETTDSVNADGNPQKSTSSTQEKDPSDETEDEIWVLETNLDDCTGEMMGLTMELLLAAGARDVNYTPIYMKKNRPAYKLEVLCKEEKVSDLEEVIFHQTTAIGLRKRKEVRRILPRKKETVMTPYGEVELKICTSAGETYIYPEYDSIRGLVQETGRSYQEIYQKAVEETWKKRKND